jgi:hypothetical protein
MNALRMWQPVLWRAIAIWLPLAVAITLLAALVYGAVQQDLRQSANEPQVQLAEDAAAQLDDGASIFSVEPTESVDIGRSLAPYLMIFDAQGQPVASSARLHGQQPPFPSSVFDDARNGQDRITWQPESGVRSAVVVQPWRGGFVVAGRSLRFVEDLSDHILLLTMFIWLLTLGATALAALLAGAILAARAGEFSQWRESRLARIIVLCRLAGET